MTIKIQEALDELKSVLAIQDIDDFASPNEGKNTPYIVLLKVGVDGRLPVFEFGVFVPQKLIDRTSKKGYEYLEAIYANLLKNHSELIDTKHIQTTLKQIENGAIYYVCIVRAERRKG